MEGRVSRNKYPGTCYRCGKTVPAGEGHFERIPVRKRQDGRAPESGKWRTQHAECAIKYRGTDHHYQSVEKVP